MRKQKTFIVNYDGNKFIRAEITGVGGEPKLFEDNMALSQVAVQQVIRNLSGKILTIIDASITNERQLKATKDLVRNAVADTFGDVSNMLWGGAVQEYADSITENMTDEEFSELEKNSVGLEEAIGV